MPCNWFPASPAGQLTSIVTDRDVKFALDPRLGLPPREAMRVRDICVFSVYTVDLDTPLFRVLETMAERRIGSALVTRHGDLCGIFTVTDACRAYGALLRRQELPTGDPEVA